MHENVGYLQRLFDYTCKECHHEHRLLREVLPLFKGELAIIAAPVPMHPDCNPAAKCKDPSRVQACAYARLIWAVWLADPAQYDAWDQFMCEDKEVQPFGLTLHKTRSLVDLNGFAFNEPDPILDAKISAGIRAYGASKAGTIPAILLPRGMLRGRVSTADELYQTIRKHP
jgi:hypothetical protein